MSQTNMRQLYDQKRIRDDFDKAAKEYEAHARLQREAAAKLISISQTLMKTHAECLDIGAGTGFLTEEAKKAALPYRFHMLDLSQAMCARLQEKFPESPIIQADCQQLPFTLPYYSLVLSNLTMQWVEDISQAFLEIYQVLKPGGLLLFSTFGPDTLKELRESFHYADGEAYRVSPFVSQSRMRHALDMLGFEGVFTDHELHHFSLPEVKHVMQQSRAVGGGNKLQQRPRGCSGKSRFARMEEYYRQHYHDGQGFRTSWEIYYISARKPK